MWRRHCTLVVIIKIYGYMGRINRVKANFSITMVKLHVVGGHYLGIDYQGPHHVPTSVPALDPSRVCQAAKPAIEDILSPLLNHVLRMLMIWRVAGAPFPAEA